MNKFKRKWDINQSFNGVVNKLQKTFDDKEKSITSIETLPNEVFYEILEYLDSCDIYKALYNLNSRFECLIICSPLPVKVKLYSTFQSVLQDYCKNIIIPNNNHIVSLYFEKGLLIYNLFTHCVIDSSFNCLESIVVNNVSVRTSIDLLFYLKSLPRFFSLTMYFVNEWDCDLSNVYRLIFALPLLTYSKLSLFSYENQQLQIVKSLDINEQFSTIKYLVINHHCTLDKLLSVLDRTPQLRHLSCGSLRQSEVIINSRKAVTLSNLKYLCMDNCLLDYDEFELFMRKICSELQILNIRQYWGKDYLHADRWERLILEHLPQLRKLNYEYHEYYTFENELAFYQMKINRFTSQFWIQRQWFFEIKISDDQITYSIRSNRKTWLDSDEYVNIGTPLSPISNHHFTECILEAKQQDVDSSLDHLVQIIQLNINSSSYDERNQLITDKFKSMFDAVKFTRLNINCKEIPNGIFIRILELLPNLDSLKVSSLPLIQPGWLFDNDGEILFLISIKNKISKVNLQKMIDVEQIHFLLYLCLSMQYFQVNVPQDINLQILLRFILTKASIYTSKFNSLRLCVTNCKDDIIHKLEKLIDTEKLLTNYRIKRIGNDILFKWNRSSCI